MEGRSCSKTFVSERQIHLQWFLPVVGYGAHHQWLQLFHPIKPDVAISISRTVLAPRIFALSFDRNSKTQSRTTYEVCLWAALFVQPYRRKSREFVPTSCS